MIAPTHHFLRIWKQAHKVCRVSLIFTLSLHHLCSWDLRAATGCGLGSLLDLASDYYSELFCWLPRKNSQMHSGTALWGGKWQECDGQHPGEYLVLGICQQCFPAFLWRLRSFPPEFSLAFSSEHNVVEPFHCHLEPSQDLRAAQGNANPSESGNKKSEIKILLSWVIKVSAKYTGLYKIRK